MEKTNTYKASSTIIALSSISKNSPGFSRGTPKFLTKNQKDLTLAGFMNRLPPLRGTILTPVPPHLLCQGRRHKTPCRSRQGLLSLLTRSNSLHGSCALYLQSALQSGRITVPAFLRRCMEMHFQGAGFPGT